MRTRFYTLDTDKSPPVLGLAVAAGSVTKGLGLTFIWWVDITLISGKMEVMEASSDMISEVASWVDW